MKKIIILSLAASMAFVLSNNAFSMDTLAQAVGDLTIADQSQGSKDDVESHEGERTESHLAERTESHGASKDSIPNITEGWDELLKQQNYKALSVELATKRDSTGSFQTSAWINSNLEDNLDPLLLYTHVRAILLQASPDHKAYAPAFRNLLLLVVLSRLAQIVALRLGYESAAGAKIPNAAKFFQDKFRYLYGKTTLSPAFLEQINFTSIRDKALARLALLIKSDEKIAALPLPHWILRTQFGWFLGWGITWSALTEVELDTRKNKIFMGSLIATTKEALGEIMDAMGELTSWEAFFDLYTEKVQST